MPKVRNVFVARLAKTQPLFDRYFVTERYFWTHKDRVPPIGFVPETEDELEAAGLSETARDYTEDWHTGRIKSLMAEPPESWEPIKLNDDGSIMNGFHRTCAAYLLGHETIRACFQHPGPMNHIEKWLCGLSEIAPSFPVSV